MNLLYLLVNQEGSAFKIGVSYCPQGRAAQLPTPINLERSLEVEFREGSATSVERMLHYLFREHRYLMPTCDGYTEWFNIRILEAVVEFLEAQKRNLGINAIRQFPKAAPNQMDKVKSAKEQAKSIQLEARRLKKEAKIAIYNEELTAAAERNLKVLNEMQRFLQAVYAADHILGILPSDSPKSDGSMYVRSEVYKATSESLSRYRLTGPGCHSTIFTGGFWSSNLKFAEINISPNMLSNPLSEGEGPFGARFWRNLPGAVQVREYLSSLITKVDSPEYDLLLQSRRKMLIQHAKFRRDRRRDLVA